MTTEVAPNQVRRVLGPPDVFVPRCIGPVWERDSFGRFVMPEFTLGWLAIEWAFENLISPNGDGPWTPTDEQARFLVWYYAVDEYGKWLYRDAILQRVKGWGKDPLAAMICAFELVGPCRPVLEDGVLLVDENGDPLGRRQPRSWIQVVGVSQDQTKNTSTMLQGIFTKAAIATYDIEIHKTIIYAHSATCRIEVTTSSYTTLEGNRPSLVIANETHHWKQSNQGDELWRVLRRNVNKGRKVAGARILSITNAYDPSQDSVAQTQREAYEKQVLRGASRVLYDSLEADETVPLYPHYTELDDDGNAVQFVEVYGDAEQIVPPSEEVVREHLRRIISTLCGDAWWLDVEETVEEILDPQSSPSEMRRFYLNSTLSGDDAYLLEADVRAIVLEAMRIEREREHGDTLRLGWAPVMPDDPIVLFLDGSKSDDSTAVVGCRISDGYTFLVGIWEKPTGDRGRGWRAPREQIDGRISEAFDRFNVVAFWADPSHSKDDEDGTRYWDVVIDRWHTRYGEQLQYWAVQGGNHRQSIMWDMATPANQALFSEAVVRFRDEVEDHEFRYDGHPALRTHLINARVAQGRFGMVIRKPARGGRRKIDAAVCAIGARMLARLVQIKGLEVEEVVGGTFWGY